MIRGIRRVPFSILSLKCRLLRKMIRESNLLRNPRDKTILKSLGGVNLHPTLVNLYQTAVENYNKYLKDPDADLHPAYVTFKDEEIFNDV